MLRIGFSRIRREDFPQMKIELNEKLKPVELNVIKYRSDRGKIFDDYFE